MNKCVNFIKDKSWLERMELNFKFKYTSAREMHKWNHLQLN